MSSPAASGSVQDTKESTTVKQRRGKGKSVAPKEPKVKDENSKQRNRLKIHNENNKKPEKSKTPSKESSITKGKEMVNADRKSGSDNKIMQQEELQSSKILSKKSIRTLDDSLSEDNRLIIKLLAMTAKARDEYLLNVAFQRSLVIKQDNKIITNPQLKKRKSSNAKETIVPEEKVENSVKKIKLKKGNDYLYQVNKFLIDNIGRVHLQLNRVRHLEIDNWDVACFRALNILENIVKIQEYFEYLVELKLGFLIEGDVQICRTNNSIAFIRNPRGRDIMIDKSILRQNAMQNDTVLVFVVDSSKKITQSESEDLSDDDLDSTASMDEDELIDEAEDVEQKRVRGLVVKIINRNHDRHCTGVMESKHIFRPRDPLIPYVIIDPVENECFITNHPEYKTSILEVVIIRWELDYPYGKIIDCIGKPGNLKDEYNLILKRNNLFPHSGKVLSDTQYNVEPMPRGAEDFMKSRIDLTDLLIFTVDPATAKDLDDALSCQALPNGNYKVGVHISDVTYYLREDSPLDKEVKEQATSIYMVDQVYHMLPIELCQLCSLLPNEHRPAFSVFFEITDNGEVLSTTFQKSLIRSRMQLSYQTAQALIDEPIDGPIELIDKKYDVCDIQIRLIIMNSIAQKIRKRRFENGAISINQPEYSFQLDGDGNPVSYNIYKPLETNKMIEEFMLLANQSVAKQIYEKYPNKAVLRCHPEPNSDSLNKLVQFMKHHGLPIDPTNSKTVASSYEKCIREASNPEAMESVMCIRFAKPMNRARYFCTNKIKDEKEAWHYALNVPMYTHFTSPIRRYSDVLVHRLLAASIGVDDEPARIEPYLQHIVEQCNAQSQNAKQASDECLELYFVEYIKRCGARTMNAVVNFIEIFAVEVVLIETGHSIRIKKRDQSGVEFQMIKSLEGSNQPTLMIRKRGKKPLKLQIFSEIAVQVYVDKKNELKAMFRYD